MEKLICPICKKETENKDFCTYCYNDLSKVDALSHTKRMMYLGVRLNDMKIIFDAATKIIEQEANDLLVKYYLLYSNDDRERFNLKLSNEIDFEEILYHMLKTSDERSLNEIKLYIINNAPQNEVKYLRIMEKVLSKLYTYEDRKKDLILLNRLKVDLNFPEIPIKNYHVRNAFFLFIIFLISLGLFYLLGIRSFSEETKYFYTVFSLIIPSLFLSASFSMLVLKKFNKIIMSIITLLSIILLGYLFLFNIEASFLDHSIRVLRAFLEFGDYLHEVVQP